MEGACRSNAEGLDFMVISGTRRVFWQHGFCFACIFGSCSLIDKMKIWWNTNSDVLFHAVSLVFTENRCI